MKASIFGFYSHLPSNDTVNEELCAHFRESYSCHAIVPTTYRLATGLYYSQFNIRADRAAHLTFRSVEDEEPTHNHMFERLRTPPAHVYEVPKFVRGGRQFVMKKSRALYTTIRVSTLPLHAIVNPAGSDAHNELVRIWRKPLEWDERRTGYEYYFCNAHGGVSLLSRSDAATILKGVRR